MEPDDAFWTVSGKCLILAARAFICGIIVLCGFLMGLEFRRRLSLRVKGLETLSRFFKDIRSYISHTGMSLSDIVVLLDELPDYAVITSKMCDKIIRSPFDKAFSEALSEAGRALSLAPDDVCSVISSVCDLGCFDTDGVLSALDMIDDRLAFLIRSARNSLETNGRLSVTLGISSGLVISLVLL